MNFQAVFNPPYDIFSIVTLFTVALSVLEIVFVLFGFSLSKLFGLDHDFNLHLDSKNGIDFPHLLDDPLHNVNLFNAGQVPFLVILLSLTSFFSFFGFGTHLVAQNLGFTLSNMIVVPLASGLSTFFTYKVSKWWKRVFPNVESYAVGGRSLVGRIGSVNLGTITCDNAVEVAVYDEHNSKHYVMASLAVTGVALNQNEKIIVVHKKDNGSYLVLPFLEKKDEQEINAT